MIVALAAGVVVLVLAAVLSGMETGLYSLERVRLEVTAARGDRAASRLLGIVSEPAGALCALLLATNVAHYVLAFFADMLVLGMAPEAGVFAHKLLDTAILAPVVFVLGDLLPKNLFMRAPFRLMRTFLPVLAAVRVLFAPFILPFARSIGRKGDAGGASGQSSIFDRGAIHFLLTVDDESAQLTQAQRTVAERVLALRSLRVQDRMVPLRRTAAVPSGATAAEIVGEGARSGHSRLPVFSPDRGRFLGYVNVIDAAAAGAEFDLSRSLHELPAVSCDLPVTAALYRLQRAGRPIAAVTTPDGRSTLGIVAVSDIVTALFRV